MRMRTAVPGLNRRRFLAASAAGLGAAGLTGPKAIFADAVGWLRERDVLLPGVSHGLFHLEAGLRWVDLTAARLAALAEEVAS